MRVVDDMPDGRSRVLEAGVAPPGTLGPLRGAVRLTARLIIAPLPRGPRDDDVGANAVSVGVLR